MINFDDAKGVVKKVPPRSVKGHTKFFVSISAGKKNPHHLTCFIDNFSCYNNNQTFMFERA